MLLIAADYNMQHKDNAKTLAYSTKLVEVLRSKAKPEELSDADWQTKKQSMLGMAYWMQGMSCNAQSHFSDADKALRNALPLVKNDSRLLPVVLFQLGVADFQIARATKNTAIMRDALKFSQQSAAIQSPVQAEAQNNLKAISRALGTTRPAVK